MTFNILDFLRRHVSDLPLIAAGVCLLAYFIYDDLGGGNIEIAITILLALVASISIYVIGTAKKIEESFNKIETILKEKSALRIREFEDINDLYKTYINISPEPGLAKFKNQIIYEVTTKLKELEKESRVKDLTPEESFKLSIPMLRKLKDGDTVMAVSFMQKKKGEFEEDSPLWDEYIEANIKAATMGATVERLFIERKENLHATLNLPRDDVVKKHSEERFNETKLKGFFLDIRNYPRERLRPIFGEGFLLINSKSTNERIAVLDTFTHSTDEYLDYRTTVTFNKDDLDKLEFYFEDMRDHHSVRLTMKS